MDDQLDQILSTDRRVAPSPGFAAAVMREVYRVADEPQPLPFPWVQFLAGLAAMLVLITMIAIVTAMPSSSLASIFATVARWGDVRLVGTGLIWVLLGGMLAYFSVQFTVRSLA